MVSYYFSCLFNLCYTLTQSENKNCHCRDVNIVFCLVFGLFNGHLPNGSYLTRTGPTFLVFCPYFALIILFKCEDHVSK